MATQQPQKPDTKRQSPNPELETAVLRARRQLRQLTERREKLVATHTQKMADIKGEEDAIRDGLSEEAGALLSKLAE